jgi:hypothetical protein|nr:hypothetical protein [uncultured Acetatifactor sp.]
MSSNELRNDINRFQDIIRNLSMGVNRSGISWRDAQYAELAGKIQSLASSSKDVIQAGERCMEAIRRFNDIASEA